MLWCFPDFTQRQCSIPDHLSAAGCVLSFSMWSWDTFTGRPMFGDRSVSSGSISVQNKKESQHFCQLNKGLLSLRQRWINCTANPNSWLKAWAAPHRSVPLDIRYMYGILWFSVRIMKPFVPTTGRPVPGSLSSDPESEHVLVDHGPLLDHGHAWPPVVGAAGGWRHEHYRLAWLFPQSNSHHQHQTP